MSIDADAPSVSNAMSALFVVFILFVLSLFVFVGNDRLHHTMQECDCLEIVWFVRY